MQSADIAELKRTLGLPMEPPVFQDKFDERGLVPAKAQEMAYEAYCCGQPFMDTLMAELMRRGANTPEQNGDWLRRGLLDESLNSRMLTDKEREHIWHRYHVPQWKRVWYRLRVRMLGYRVR